jgi:hypothetical protein
MDALKFFDAYALRARIFPAVIATASVIVLLGAVVPWHRLSWTHLFASAAILVILYAGADVARRRGTGDRTRLDPEMGGLPNITMMLHSDGTFPDAAAKVRMHQFLAGKTGGKAPTVAEQTADPAAADKFYAACGNWLRENTRDQKQFGILFNENIAYGFRRNLLGLRLPAFVLDTAVIVICAVALWLRRPFNIDDEWTLTFLVVAGIAALHALYFAAFANSESVFEAARVYARQLLLSCEALQIAAPKPAKKA